MTSDGGLPVRDYVVRESREWICSAGGAVSQQKIESAPHYACRKEH